MLAYLKIQKKPAVVASKETDLVQILLLPSMNLQMVVHSGGIEFMQIDPKCIPFFVEEAMKQSLKINLDGPDADEIYRCAKMHEKISAMITAIGALQNSPVTA